MNQADLENLVFGVLNRKCACQSIAHGNSCPEGKIWHTWRRRNLNGGYYKTKAIAFVGIDGGPQSEIFKVDYVDTLQAQSIIVHAQQSGVSGISIDPGFSNRVIFNTTDIALNMHRQFYEKVIKKGINE